jgi:predicted polyphosphate/ATP-dependent NAD kinase
VTRRVALIVNPVAGMGGRVGLKGTDGPELLRRALERGAAPVAPARAARALARLIERVPAGTEVVAPADLLDDAAVRAAGVALTAAPTPGSPAQTRAAAAALAADGVDLILFAGGDGTARDVSAAVASVSSRVPILGVPAGVKMHSGCFAATPEAAGDAAAAYLHAPAAEALTEAEIADAAEPASELRSFGAPGGRQTTAAPGQARLSTVLHGVALVPRAPGRRLGPKQTSAAGAALDGACARVAAEVDPGALTLFGPGTTTARVLRALGHEPTLRGVDAVRGGALVARDATEAELLALLDAHAPAGAAGATGATGAAGAHRAAGAAGAHRAAGAAGAHGAARAAGAPAATGGRAATSGPVPPAAHLVLGVVGGQGSLLGRGNQQLSPAVLRRIDRSNITVVADRGKLLALSPPQLHVDTGDPALDHELSGHVRVRVAARETLMCAVAC